MKRWHRRLLILALVVVAILVLRTTVFKPAPVPVTVTAVERGRVEDTVVNSRAGTVESRLRAKMSPALAGLVVEIPVHKGQAVKRGAVLLRLDDSEHQAQVNLAARSRDAAIAVASEACLSSEQAIRERRRAEALAEQGLLSDENLELAITQSEVARAACKAAEEKVKQAGAALAAARATLTKTIMVAPFDGVVLDVTTEVGEWISPSPPGVFIPPVVDIIDPHSLYVSAPIDEADVASIRTELPVRITLDAFRGQSFPGRITYVASFVETQQEQNRTLKVDAEFDSENLPRGLLPGISADIEVILDARDNVNRVPTYTLVDGNHVLIVNGDRLEKIAVETGLRNWAFTEITSGIDHGDKVVVSLDRPEVKAGATVSITEESGS